MKLKSSRQPILACTVFDWSTRVTDGRTDGWTDRITITTTRLALVLSRVKIMTLIPKLVINDESLSVSSIHYIKPTCDHGFSEFAVFSRDWKHTTRNPGDTTRVRLISASIKAIKRDKVMRQHCSDSVKAGQIELTAEWVELTNCNL